MDINQLRTTRELALRQRTACTLIPGMGYVRLGEHRFPDTVIYPPSACTPPEGAEDMSLHHFIPPGGEKPTVMLYWLAEDHLWQPISPTAGNRLAFRPAYLAALGWKRADD